MKLLNTATTVCCLALMGAVFTPSVRADESNRKTIITLSGPVEIPGVHLTGWGILPAGTYVFKVTDSLSDRHIVQIFDKDETTIYATILAIPNYRLKATDKTVMTFTERPAGQPEALRAWFYPGRNWGEEFVYPKARAMELAKAGNTPVLFTTSDMPAEVTTPIRPTDAPTIAQFRRAPLMAVRPSGEEVKLADVVEAPPAVSAPATTAAAAPAQATTAAAPMADTLPATASPLPFAGLVGLLALAAGFAVRAIAPRA